MAASTCCKDDIFSNLLSPFEIQNQFKFSHRIVLAPLTRCRAINYVPQSAHVEYYAERTTKGGLLISEAVAVSQQGIGFPHSPGIWAEDQVDAWRAVVDAVHARGGVIFCQLWHVGRASHAYYQPDGKAPVSSTARRAPGTVLLPDGVKADYAEPRALEKHEILDIVEQFRLAARNAKRAGFDGVEIHSAHGYLIDQFLKDGINDRKDEYGGSIKNRCRFALQVLDAVANEIGGQRRTAIRISPIITHNGATDSRPTALAVHLATLLNRRLHRLAYLHVTEPRFTRHGVIELDDPEASTICLRLRAAFNGPLMLSGGFRRESAMEAIRTRAADMVSFGRLFISNPDLPLRFALNAPLNEYDRATFYTHHPRIGYLDYPLLKNPLDATRIVHHHEASEES